MAAPLDALRQQLEVNYVTPEERMTWPRVKIFVRWFIAWTAAHPDQPLLIDADGMTAEGVYLIRRLVARGPWKPTVLVRIISRPPLT
jgi:hypothetical protein